MFYSAQVLCKKGPLATIWIAAHLDRRLKRRDVFTTNITDSVGKLSSKLSRQQKNSCTFTSTIGKLLWHSDCFSLLPCVVAENIIDPQTPLALRLSGQLLLGVVKIFSKKVSYLYDDCSSAVVKIQQVSAMGRDKRRPFFGARPCMGCLREPWLPSHRCSSQLMATCWRDQTSMLSMPSHCQRTSTTWSFLLQTSGRHQVR